jgi:hypothetical protein
VFGGDCVVGGLSSSLLAASKAALCELNDELLAAELAKAKINQTIKFN